MPFLSALRLPSLCGKIILHLEGRRFYVLKPLPIGVDNFENLIKNNYYFVDKTLFIRELLEMKGEVNLFTRPRRFGKTLNMRMLRCFF